MNKWQVHGEKQLVAPQRTKMRAAKTRAERKRQKKQEDDTKLLGIWKEWHLKRKAELLAGTWSEAARELVEFLERMTIADAPALIALVERGPWREADANTKFLVLGLIGHNIIYLRERAGLPPFDDPSDDEETNAFIIIRRMLNEYREGSV